MKLCTLLVLFFSLACAETPFGALRWRNIGPYRGGRTIAIAGVPEQPHLFYMAAVNGGIFRSDDAARTWTPIFDDQPTGSIGALAIAPSNPKIIYAGSGEGRQRPDLATGDGIYKSLDAGKTWQHLGLRDAQQIAWILVDPRNADRLFVAALGHPYGPNPERGVFRSTDGGKSFQKVLYKDENTGAIDLAFAPGNPNTLYAALYAARQAPWEMGDSYLGPGSGLFKSTDGGTTWRQLSKGLPTPAEGLGRIGIGVSPSNPRRVYAMVVAKKAGLYRSDDAGESWVHVNGDGRMWHRAYDLNCVRVDPRDADVLWISSTSLWRSTDGGKTVESVKGAPGGDDYHNMWINPLHPEILAVGADQGATVSLNGGRTWSTWYNQSTAQFYHVITDNRFPYWVYGGQQESGSAGVASRGDYGAVTARDWYPVGASEYAYIAPDPLHPNIVYGSGGTRFDHNTRQVQFVGPDVAGTGKFRRVRTMPIIFSEANPRMLLLAMNVLFKTTDGVAKWEQISGDLTRETWEMPPSLGIFTEKDPEKGKHRGVIYAVAPSPKAADVIWAGTDDGLIHLTRDGGKNWANVTPPQLTPWSKVSQLDAGRFDEGTAYAAINRFRLDDLRPHIYRTHDFGKTWSEITQGIPANEVCNAVREDRKRRGLLFAATERAVYVSFNDGGLWQPLRLNMPATSIRDIVIHDDDLVAGTHGRGFWILDNIEPLRQTAADATFLFRPQPAWRVRWNKNTDTPLPVDEPVGENPPDGAIVDYQVARAGAPVTLEILDGAGQVVRKYSSADKPEISEVELNKELAVPTFWARPSAILPGAAGPHRFVWDLHYTAPDAISRVYPISAIFKNTPREPRGPVALPGDYTVRLTVDGKRYEQPLRIRMDPRVESGADALARQFEASQKLCTMMARTYALRQQPAAARLNAQLGQLLEQIDSADAAPTAKALEAIAELQSAVNALQ